MSAGSFSVTLDGDTATAVAAASMGPRLDPGDIILLSGPVGAGKTHFARHLIQSILITPEDVPSPTFTLVQNYDTTRGVLWHTDLYRISTDAELDELGLLEAFEESICLVEWPDRLGPLKPGNALDLALSDGPSEDSRHLTATWTDPRWTAKTEVLRQ